MDIIGDISKRYVHNNRDVFCGKQNTLCYKLNYSLNHLYNEGSMVANCIVCVCSSIMTLRVGERQILMDAESCVFSMSHSCISVTSC